MPEISRFFGIIIRMFFLKSEHNPPHFHAFYGDEMSEFDIKTLEVIEGDLNKVAVKLVKIWAKQHQKELLAIWEGQMFDKIKPLGKED
jgi:hypothetical protein